MVNIASFYFDLGLPRDYFAYASIREKRKIRRFISIVAISYYKKGYYICIYLAWYELNNFNN